MTICSAAFSICAVDCPSGVDCDSGEAAACVLPAELTICMDAVKVGLLRFPAFNYVGRLAVVDLGLPKDLPALQKINNYVVSAAEVERNLPARPKDAHKGTFGTALVVAGSVNFTGAAALAGEAAYRIDARPQAGADGVPNPTARGALGAPGQRSLGCLLPQTEMGVICRGSCRRGVRQLERVTGDSHRAGV